MNSPLFFIFIISSGLIAFCTATIFTHYNKEQRAALFTLDHVPWETDPKTQLQYRSIGVPEGRSSSFQRIQVLLKQSPGASFSVSLETSIDRLATSFGLSEELQTGEPEFDHAFYLACALNEELDAFFSNSDHKDAIRQIFSQAVREFFSDGKVLQLDRPFRLQNGKKVRSIDDVLSSLLLLASAVPQENSAPPLKNPLSEIKLLRKLSRLWFFSIFAVFITSAIIILPARPRLAELSLGYGWAAGFGLALWRTLRLRKTAFAQRVFMAWTPFAALVVPTFFCISFIFLNAKLDDQAPVMISGSLQEVVEKQSKSGPYFQMEVALPATRKSQIEIPEYLQAVTIPQGLADHLNRGRTVYLFFRPGYFHLPTLAYYRLD